MQLFPAIDLRHGRVVRLSQGEATRQTLYGDDPVVVAERFVAAGAAWIHVVDLDRAFGDGDNGAIIAEIARRIGREAKVQVGGGIRDVGRVSELLAWPISRVVLGTAAISDPEFVPRVLALAGAERVVVGIDARDGVVALRGWRETSGEATDAVARRMAEYGVRTIIYTDIGRDGMLSGPDIAGSLAVQAVGVEVIASGGVGTLDDLRAIARAELGGAVVGRALYEQRFTLPEALAAAAER